MNKGDNKKRLFIGLEIASLWPQKFPTGRIIEEEDRHMTLIFLGTVSLSSVLEILQQNIPSFSIGFAGMFNKILLLPPKYPKVFAWNMKWLEDVDPLFAYRKQLYTQLIQQNLVSSEEKRPFLSHLTLARSPFDKKEWEHRFAPLPLYAKALHLYESKGSLKYQSLWQYDLLPPFEEKEHKADLAFTIRGHTIEQLLSHAFIALAFHFPPFVCYANHLVEPHESIEKIVMILNNLITMADIDRGCPFKAVSYHSKIEEKNQYLEWEMIVDV